MLTTYETVRDRESLFAPLKFGVVVFDEMQKIKAPDSLITKCAKALNADFVVGMTGTPVENRLADLWCLVDRVWPGYLGELKAFSLQYEKKGDACGSEELKTRLMINKTTSPALLLRRMKHDHLEGLPERETKRHRVEMPPEQASRYMEVVEKARGSDERGAMLEGLQQMRGLSLHPMHPEQAGNLTDERYIAQSARLAATFKILDEVHAKKEKALIFLEHLAMQDYLAVLIQRRYRLTTLPLLINGDVTGTERQRRVNQFQSAPRQFEAMILSPRAGGVGLTLTAANHVIHLSRWWNPAVEDQCSDRVYRIGQEQPVCIHFPIAIHPQLGESSFDVKLDLLLERKRQLSRDLLAPSSATDEDLQNLWRDTITPESSISPGRKILSADEIGAMEPRQFERWVADTLRTAGWQIRLPPKSHDGGADVIGHRNGLWLLVQCKHTQGKGPRTSSGIGDLLRAKVAYSVDTTAMVLISNASEFDAYTVALANQHKITLINQVGLASWPEQLNA